VTAQHKGVVSRPISAAEIISFIEDREVIKSILKHLGLRLVKLGPSSEAHAPPLVNDRQEVAYEMELPKGADTMAPGRFLYSLWSLSGAQMRSFLN
jgi:hypothetical protein